MNKTPKEEAEIKRKEYNDNFAGSSEERAKKVSIINTGATFNGDGNGSHYENCCIDMKSDFRSSPSPMKVQRSPS